MKDKMLDYLASHNFCVISTVDDQSSPESAYVGFRHNQNLEILIGTSKNSRKFKNILQNNRVALVMADLTGEVQYEGVAEVVNADEHDALVEAGHFMPLPGMAKYREDPTQVWIKVSPTWIRFIQHGAPDQIEEFTEFPL